MTYQPRNVLVTGGCGFIGSHFILQAHQAWPQAQLVNLDVLSYAADVRYLDALRDSPRYHFYKGDICSINTVVEVMHEYHIDTIVHFAAESHVDRSIGGPIDFVVSNILGTSVLLECARDYWLTLKKWGPNECRFHHISTDEVFGSLSMDDPAFSETTAYAPKSPYSASKASSDHLVCAWGNTYGFPYTLSNCSNNYGPHQHAEKLIPTVIRCCLQQKPIPIYGRGDNRRDWLYVVDHCRGILKIMTEGRLGESYVIGGGYECSNMEIVAKITALMDELVPQGAPHQRLVSYVEDRAGHDFRYAINPQKIQQELDFYPQYVFDDALRETVLWYLQRAGIKPYE